MSEEETTLKTWEQVIIDFFERRVAQSKLYKAREYIEKKEKDIKAGKEENKLERLIKAKENKQNELTALRKNAPSTEIREWIEKTRKTKVAVGKRIIKATHVLKFSHGSAASDGAILTKKTNDAVLTTSSLKKELTYDLAHNNGALITISRFLSLKLSENHVIDLILKDDYSFLKPFAKDEEQLDEWRVGFKNLVEKREIKTADKAKQIYFPTADNKYHLVVPLFASSLAEEVFTTVNNLKFGEEQKKVKKQAGENSNESSSYHSMPYVDLPSLGVQKFGGSQPQNISMLNKGRSWKANKKDKITWGITYLFSSQPPTWQSKLTAPIYRKSLFDDFYHTSIKTDIDYLRDFLLRFKKLDLSIKAPKRMRHLERWLSSIIDEFLFYAASIQNLPAAWSVKEGIKLKSSHQYFLDPYRSDESFQVGRQSSNWQTVIRADFAQWLNHQLRPFTPQKEHTKLWKSLLETPLREFMEPIEIEIKQGMRESV